MATVQCTSVNNSFLFEREKHTKNGHFHIEKNDIVERSLEIWGQASAIFFKC